MDIGLIIDFLAFHEVDSANLQCAYVLIPPKKLIMVIFIGFQSILILGTFGFFGIFQIGKICRCTAISTQECTVAHWNMPNMPPTGILCTFKYQRHWYMPKKSSRG